MSDSFAIVERETLLTSYVFSVERRTIIHEGQEFTRDIAVHHGAVAMVAVNERGRPGLVGDPRGDHRCERPRSTGDGEA